MFSHILSSAARYLFPLMMLFSVFLLLRGHNKPGGGFVGGLVAASAFALYTIAHGIKAARRFHTVDPFVHIGLGLLIAVSSALLPVFQGKNFMTGLWSDVPIPVIHHIGTPAIFDLGVYLVVLGITLKIIFVLSDEEVQRWK